MKLPYILKHCIIVLKSLDVKQIPPVISDSPVIAVPDSLAPFHNSAPKGPVFYDAPSHVVLYLHSKRHIYRVCSGYLARVSSSPCYIVCIPGCTGQNVKQLVSCQTRRTIYRGNLLIALIQLFLECGLRYQNAYAVVVSAGMAN